MEDEIWKVVPSLLDYEASSLGRVRRIPFFGVMPHGGKRQYGGKACLGTLRKDKMRYFITYKGKNYAVHRMVCEAFHGKQPFPYPASVATHINEDAMDNKASNLMWRSQKENLNDPKFIAYCKTRTGDNNPLTKGKLLKLAYKSTT